ncbi:MAG: tRNA (adenosine(37)-N6)-threonylcarbamoyltransferase complex dimerization subunit type 1 TsaB [Salibacteraceae bacterium]
MGLILNIESATTNCSASLAEDGVLIATKQIDDGYRHAEQLAPFVHEVLHTGGAKASQLDAVAVSAGPGSYTGLRIGVALAKGICYAQKLPLIAISTLRLMCASPLVREAAAKYTKVVLCPMLDARRMEVYKALYDIHLNELSAPEPHVLGPNSLMEEAAADTVLIFGPGAHKFNALNNNERIVYVDGVKPDAALMPALSEPAWQQQNFENLAYFEPAYLKSFVATKPKQVI